MVRCLCAAQWRLSRRAPRDSFSIMLKLRRAKVLEARPPDGLEQQLVIVLVSASAPASSHAHGEALDAREAQGQRAAVDDVGLVGLGEAGDEVIVNVEALDLGLGSGGFDVVHVNLTRGLQAQG